MNENLDLTKILKDCPKGTKLYSTIFGEVEFIRIDDNSIDYPIDFNTLDGFTLSLTSDGRYNKDYQGECTLFPSKDQRDWSKWHRPFKVGDILASKNGIVIGIIKGKNNESFETYCAINEIGSLKINTPYHFERFATEKEKQKLFDAIKAIGYRWNAKTKTLEKLTEPKFKVGDRIKHKDSGNILKIDEIDMSDSIYCCGLDYVWVSDQDNYELVPNKFHPKTLKPFDKVLVKQYDRMSWCADLYSYYDEDDGFVACTGEVHYDYCIPYNEETKHLTGTVDDAPEFYRYWED